MPRKKPTHGGCVNHRDEKCYGCGHTKYQHDSAEGDCDGCYLEGRAVLCGKWHDEPRDNDPWGTPGVSW